MLCRCGNVYSDVGKLGHVSDLIWRGKITWKEARKLPEKGECQDCKSVEGY